VITQVLKYLQCGTQDYRELFPKLSKDNIVKIILRLMKRLSPPANDELNSTLVVQNAVGHKFSANSFQNKQFPDSNVTQSLKEKLVSAIRQTLLTVPSLKRAKA